MSFPMALISTDFFRDELRILFVAKCELRKGLDTLIAALTLLGAAPWRLTVGGDGWRDQTYVSELLKELQPGRVTFVGRIDNDNLVYVMHAHDIAVVPSHYENFGNVSIEAQAAGLPVVASRVGGLQSTVKDGETGHLFAAGNALDLATVIFNKILIEPRHKLSELALNARKRAEDLYDWRHIVERYEQAFLETPGTYQ